MKDVTAKVSTRDDGKFRRTAIHIRDDGSCLASVDVIGLDGSLVCRLNLFDFGNEEACVDVILNETCQQGRFFALDKGRTQVSIPTIFGTTVHTVVISPPGAKQGTPVPGPAVASA